MIGAIGLILVAVAGAMPLMHVAWKMTTPPPARKMFHAQDR